MDKSVGDEQGGFWKGRGGVDQIFTVKILVEKYLGKDRKLFAAFMDLEKAYDRVDRKNIRTKESARGQTAYTGQLLHPTIPPITIYLPHP